ncbi:hypothetical protein [Mangrovimonas aestuarii]|uniref:hypothetical protein n=1 Tax=Mangrovimonas aestuarii TaxID=3018443 RepID=UPI002378EF54|nr:hypothetical protein [Mangrovimonas aestuarii]
MKKLSYAIAVVGIIALAGSQSAMAQQSKSAIKTEATAPQKTKAQLAQEHLDQIQVEKDHLKKLKDEGTLTAEAYEKRLAVLIDQEDYYKAELATASK